MKIKRLEIYGYGKWIDQEFDLDENLQVFYGSNEAGKSTLLSFIKSILFGFPDKRRRVNQINRYVPRQSDTYGGRILLTGTERGDVWVERKEKSLKVTTIQGEELTEKHLSEILGGLTEELFDTYYSFNLENLQELANIGKDELNEHFLSIGTAGSDHYLKLIKEMDKEADEIYRPRARKLDLNIALNDYQDSCEKLVGFEANMKNYDKLIGEETQIIAQIDNLNNEIDLIDKKTQELKTLSERYGIYQKTLAIKAELKDLKYTPIPTGAADKLKEKIVTNQKTQTELIENQERLRNLTEQLTGLDDYHWAKDHKEERLQWKKNLEKAKSLQTSYENLSSRIAEADEELKRIAQRGNFSPDKINKVSDYNEKTKEALELVAQQQELDEEAKRIELTRQLYLNERNDQQKLRAKIRQELVNLENKRIIEEDQLIQNTSPKQYTVPSLAVLFGLLLLTVAFIMPDSSWVMMFSGIILMVIGLGAGVYVFLKLNKLKETYENNPILARIDQLTNQEKSVNQKIENLTNNLSQQDDKLNKVQAEQVALKSKEDEWLEALGFYPNANIEWVLQTDPIGQYEEALERKFASEKELKNIDLELIKWRESIELLTEKYPPTSHQTRPLIRHVEELEAQFVESERHGQHLEKEIKNIKDKVAHLEDSQNNLKTSIQEILDQADSSNEFEFNEKVKINNKIESLKRELDLLNQQIFDYKNSLKEVSSREQLQKSYLENTQKRQQLRTEVSNLETKRADLTHQIKKLEKDGSYQDLTQRLESQKTDLIKLIIKWAENKLASSLLTQALSQGLENPIPEMNKIAVEIFERLSGGRYNDININKNNIKVRQYTDVLFEIHELSQGTLEQLYVALRLAFILCARSQVQMPIIIDDAFVNFDEGRKNKMYDVLDEISQDCQILFFTFDKEAGERWSGQQLINLDATEEIKEQELEGVD